MVLAAALVDKEEEMERTFDPKVGQCSSVISHAQSSADYDTL